jgi:competence protein ComEC
VESNTSSGLAGSQEFSPQVSERPAREPINPLPAKARFAPAPLLPVALGATAGVCLEDFHPNSLLLLIALLVVSCALTFFRTGAFSLACISMSGFALLHHLTDSSSPNRPPPALANALLPITATLEGRVTRSPEPLPSSAKFQKSRLRLKVDIPPDPPCLPAHSTILVHWTGPPPAAGDRVRIRAALQRVASARNPGEFDRVSFFRRQKLWLEATVRDPLDTTILSHPDGFNLEGFAADCRTAISHQLRRGIEDRPQTHALISSMILGLHGDGLMEAKPAFRDTGTLHLFAVSGLNLSMLAGLLGYLFRRIRLGPSGAAYLTLPILILYGLATGLGPSCVRALVMSLLLLSGLWIKRPAVVLNSLSAAALLLLAGDTNTLFNAGFQLSFGLVLALAASTQPLSQFFEKPALPDSLLPRRLWNSTQERVLALWRPVAAGGAVTVVAWLAGLPWNIFLFHQLTPVALLANIVAVPMAFINLSLGFLALLTAPFGPLTPTLNRLNATCAETLFGFVQWASHIPGGRFPIPAPFQSRPDFLVFDLLDGAAVMLRADNQVCLLDCGSDMQTRATLIPGLQYFGVTSIASLILSHGSASYIGGALSITEMLSPASVFDSPIKDRSRTRRQLHEWWEATRQPIVRITAGDTIPLGSNTLIEILHPPPAVNGTIADDKCIIVRWKTPTFTLLYTASAGFPSERWLLEHCKSSLASDIWIRGWHSREMTGTEEFVRAIQPQAIVITRQRITRDPEKAALWIARRRQEGIRVFDQQESGAVLGTKQPDGVEVRAFLGEHRARLPP